MCAEISENKGKNNKNSLRKDLLGAVLSRLVVVDNVVSSCVVGPDGEVVRSEGSMNKEELRSYGAMCATMFAAAKETSEGSDSKGIEINITDNDPAGEIYIRGLERDYILVARTKEGKNQDEIQKEMQKIAEFLTEDKKWMKDQLISSLKKKYKQK